MSDIAHLPTHLGSSSARSARFERSEATPDAATSVSARHGRDRNDAVEISADARRHATQEAAGSPTAAEPAPDLARIARVRSEIAAGGYDSDARLQVAIDRMIDDIVA